jgi:O-antigen/teichoic acid export membrane protein
MDRATLRVRLRAALGANIFNQAVVLVVQVSTVPIALHFWGARQFGEWLTLSAIPSYLGMTDIGFSSAANNVMCMHTAEGAYDKALRTFQSTWVLVSLVTAAVATALFVVASTLPTTRLLSLQTFSMNDVRITIAGLCLYSFSVLQEGLVGAGYRADGRYGLGRTLTSLIRLVETVLFLGAISLGARPATGALVLGSARTVGVLLERLVLRRTTPWLRYGIAHADRESVRELTRPAFAFMGFPLGNLLGLEGMILAVNQTLGPVAVVAWSTVRTLTRAALQVLSVINSSVWPERTFPYGSRDVALMRRLHRAACQISLYTAVVSVTGLAVVGPTIIRIWTNGRVHDVNMLLWILLVEILVSSFWYTSSVVGAATNNHVRIARRYLVGSALSLLVAIPLLSTIGLNGGALALLSTDLLMLPLVVRVSLELCDDSLPDFLAHIVRPPSVLLRLLR